MIWNRKKRKLKNKHLAKNVKSLQWINTESIKEISEIGWIRSGYGLSIYIMYPIEKITDTWIAWDRENMHFLLHNSKNHQIITIKIKNWNSYIYISQLDADSLGVNLIFLKRFLERNLNSNNVIITTDD